jgi:hypothetical protein
MRLQGVYHYVRSLFGTLSVVSATLAVGLVAAMGLSYSLAHHDSLRPGLAIAPHFHVAVSDGALLSYSDVFFMGGTWAIVRDNEPPPYRERVLGFRDCRYVAVHYASATLWRLRVPLGYPIALLGVPSLVWLCRPRRAHSIT